VLTRDSAALVLLGAAVLDYAIGDPWGWLHPVQVMGWYINGWSRCTWRFLTSPFAQKLSGVGLCASLVLLCGGGSWLLLNYLSLWQPWLAIGLQIILVASCLAGRSLRVAAMDVLAALPDLPEMRNRLARYVGRDTDRLTVSEIYRAVLETVAENAIDGATAPWFYALSGAAIGLGPLPLALAYKAASTLDSMVGYRRSPYEHLGWASAKFEDMVTWLPCRLTVLTLGLISGRPLQVWRICRRDAVHDPSPNSGWSECIYAAILGVQLGGDNFYRGELKTKPLLGDNLGAIEAKTIDQALGLTRIVLVLWLFITMAGLYARA
jgi:adenosylcobinamide-phosphate synthase